MPDPSTQLRLSILFKGYSQEAWSYILTVSPLGSFNITIDIPAEADYGNIPLSLELDSQTISWHELLIADPRYHFPITPLLIVHTELPLPF